MAWTNEKSAEESITPAFTAEPWIILFLTLYGRNVSCGM